VVPGVLLALLAAAWLARGWLLPAAGRFLDVSEPPREVDAVMVLGGGPTTRPFVAASLARAGLARRVLVPTFTEDDSASLSEQEVVRRVLRARGVPDGAVVTLPGAVERTQDEAWALARFLDEEPGATVAVVTSDFHTRRARMLFRREVGSHIDRVHFVAAPTDGFGADDWWRCEEGAATYLLEYFKLAYYGLTGERSWQAVVLGIVLAIAGAVVVWRRRRARPAGPVVPSTLSES
jgi:LPXTG-motif cell wall-anchored protein